MKFRLKTTVEHLRRYRHILAVLMKYGFDEVVGALRQKLALRLGDKAMPTRVKRAPGRRTRPQRVRLALTELGPTFIKLGQLLSTRPDLVPPEYVKELERLQDQVAPVKFSRIRREVERQLDGKLSDLFRDFDEQPIAAGSIAQVHCAVTRQGENVVVKVRRPGIVNAIRTECEILEDLAGLLKAAMFENDTLDPVRMVHEFAQAVTKEVDLNYEAGNLRRFGRNFAGDPTVHIPKVFDDYSTEGVLTMDRIEGIKCSDLDALRAAGLDPKVIARRGARFILRQVFDFGFFHADPHPGNIFVLPNNVLAPLDFGQVARLSEDNRRLISQSVLAVAEADADRLVRAFGRANMLEEDTDARALAADLDDMFDAYGSLALKEIPVGQAIAHTFEVVRRHRVHPPSEFTLMLKSLMTLESLAHMLDEDFQLVDHLKPYARRLALERMDPRRLMRMGRRALRDAADLAAIIPEQVDTLLSTLRRGKFQVHVQHEHLESLMHTLDRSSNRIAFGLVIAGTVVASSLLVSQEQRTLWGLVRLDTLGIFGYLAAAILGLWLLVSILRSRKV